MEYVIGLSIYSRREPHYMPYARSEVEEEKSGVVIGGEGKCAFKFLDSDVIIYLLLRI